MNLAELLELSVRENVIELSFKINAIVDVELLIDSQNKY